MSHPHRPNTHARGPLRRAQQGPSLPHGASVVTRDGYKLGRIKESNDRCFLIDVRLAFDYWLSTRAVASVHDGEVDLGIEKREVGRYLVDIDCLDDFNDLPSVIGGGKQPATASA